MKREINFRIYGFLSQGEKGMYYFDIYNVPNIPEEDIVMQSTNLLDKNGKEIYEGDVVVRELEGEMVGEVFLHNSYGCAARWKYRLPNETQRKDFFLTGTIAEDIFEDGVWEWITDVIVIGNIYENPDLINPK